MEVISWLIVEKLVANYIFCNFWFLNSYSLMSHLKLTGVSYWSPQFLSVISLPVGCIKREENVINIAKPCIHKAAGSGINEMLFPIFSWRYTLFIILEPGLTNSVQCTASMPIYSCVCQKILKHLCWPFSPLHIFGFHYFLQHATIIVLLCGMSFTLEIKKTLYATLHSITRERYFTERWM